MAYEQDKRTAYIKVDGKDKVLLLKSMNGTDRVGQPFTYVVEMLINTDVTNFKITDYIGKKVTIFFRNPDGKGDPRELSGYVGDARYSGSSGYGGMDLVHFLVVPWIWFLTKASKCRIFKGMTVLEILEAIFKLTKFESDHYDLSEIKSEFPKMEHCVQYQETDFAFVSRLMEQFGISYYFEHKDEGHKLMLFYSKEGRGGKPTGGFDKFEYSDAQSAADAETNVITRLEHRTQVTSNEFSQAHFSHVDKNKLPDIEVLTKKEGSPPGELSKGEFEQYVYEGVIVEDGVSSISKELEKFKDLEKVRLGTFKAEEELIYGESECRRICAGYQFTLSEYSDTSLNQKYFVLAVHHNIENGYYAAGSPKVDKRYTCSFTAMPDESEYYPARLTPKPRIYGPQTAIVVSGELEDGQEVNTDAIGRVKVKFHWDRDSDRGDVHDEIKKPEPEVKAESKKRNHSCWVRVAQAWAGNAYGCFFLPRVDHEVIVEFLDGDPDRPIVTGSVHSPKNIVPFKLTDHSSVSVIRTNGISEKGEASTDLEKFNEIRFEDKEGCQNIRITSPSLDTDVKGDDRKNVGGNIHTSIGDGKEGDSVDKTVGNRVVMLKGKGVDKVELEEGDQVVKLGKGNQHFIVGKNQNTIVTGEQIIKTGGLSLDVGGEIHIVSGKASYLTSEDEIHVTAKNTFLTASTKAHITADSFHLTTKSGVNIKGGSKGVLITSDGDVGISGKNIILAADTAVQFAAGSNFFNIDSKGVSMKGSKIDMNGGGSAGKADPAVKAEDATEATKKAPEPAPAPEVTAMPTTKEQANVSKKEVSKDIYEKGKAE